MSFQIGETIGDYEVVGILGTGGMGKVYKVRNTISDRIEAMKVLLPNLTDEPEVADRFMREIKLLASLNHPHIAGLHTALRINNQLLMLMEFVEGRTLEDRLREGRVPVAEAVGYMTQALSALSYAHERGVVHRDIKPPNMMVTSAGELKLMDFGIAKAVADRRLTQTGTTLGSLYYMSPEQVRGSAGLDGRSDLYSVGISLYELVTGTRPFKGDSDYSIMVAHLEQQAVPPTQVDPSLPPALNEIIMTAIQKDAEQRFQTANAMRIALESLGMTEARPGPPPVMESAPPPPPPPQAVRSSHRGLWVALGALLVLAVLAVAALQLPRVFRTRAGVEAPAAEPAAQTAAPPAAEPAQPAPVEPAAAVPEPQETPASGAPAADQPAVARPPAERRAVRTAPPPAAVEPAPSQAEPAPPASEPAVSAAQQAPPAAPESPAEIEEARERMTSLAIRGATARSTLQTLEAQQKRAGYGLRRDMVESWQRMEFLLDEAEAAIKKGNAASAKRNLDLAEREIDKLDKFLGR
jgi:serine/threonine-protein kinase